MSTIAYFVHGRGRGHASRSEPIIAALRAAGHRVHVAAGGDAVGLFGIGPAAGDREIAPVLPGRAVGRALARRTLRDREWLRSIDAELVVTDGDAPGMNAAWSLGIPCVAVGHGLIFAYCRLPPQLPWGGRLREALNAGSSAWLARRRVGVHFQPIEPRDDRTLIARPDLDPRLVPSPPRTDRFVAYFRDQNGGPVLEAAVAAGLAVTCFGPCRDVPATVEQRPLDRETFLSELIDSRGLISSSGSNALAEAVAVRRPVLAVHRSDDFEQAMNARLLQRAGLGEALALDDALAPKVRRYAERCARDQFAHFDLRAMMSPVSRVVVDTIDAITRMDARS